LPTLFQAWGIADLSLLKPAKDAFYPSFFNRTEVYPESRIRFKKNSRRKISKSVCSRIRLNGADKEYLIGSTPQINRYFDSCLASTEVGFPETAHQRVSATAPGAAGASGRMSFCRG